MELLMKYLIDNNYIEQEEHGFIKYGVEVLVLNFLSILSIIGVSVIINNVEMGISFLINFILIRTHLGGFHCKKPVNCLMIFPIIYYLMVYVLNKFPLLLIIKCVFVILILLIDVTPIKNNVNIDKVNFQRCKKILNLLVIFYLLVDFVAYILNINNTVLLRGMNYSIILSTVLYFYEKIERLLKARWFR